MLTSLFLNLFTGKLALTNRLGLAFMLASLCINKKKKHNNIKACNRTGKLYQTEQLLHYYVLLRGKGKLSQNTFFNKFGAE